MAKKKKKTRKPYSTRAFYARWNAFQTPRDVYKEIWEKFVVPIVNHMDPMSEQTNVEDLVDIAFGVGQRRIFTCRLKAPLSQFKGWYKRRPCKWWLTSGRRYFKEGTYVMVRLDKRVPDQIEVEFFESWDDDHTWEFCLTPAEFDYIQKKLKLVESREDVANFRRYRNRVRSRRVS